MVQSYTLQSPLESGSIQQRFLLPLEASQACHLGWQSESEPWVKDSQTCLEPPRKCLEQFPE
jgi:hypothetical protein